MPTYAIFAPDTGALEVYHLNDAGRYQLSTHDINNRYWIAQMNLFLGVWQGTRENRTGSWLRWWDDAGIFCCGALRRQHSYRNKQLNNSKEPIA